MQKEEIGHKKKKKEKEKRKKKTLLGQTHTGSWQVDIKFPMYILLFNNFN